MGGPAKGWAGYSLAIIIVLDRGPYLAIVMV